MSIARPSPHCQEHLFFCSSVLLIKIRAKIARRIVKPLPKLFERTETTTSNYRIYTKCKQSKAGETISIQAENGAASLSTLQAMATEESSPACLPSRWSERILLFPLFFLFPKDASSLELCRPSCHRRMDEPTRVSYRYKMARIQRSLHQTSFRRCEVPIATTKLFSEMTPRFCKFCTAGRIVAEDNSNRIPLLANVF